MKVLKICIGDWSNASRDQRELTVCRELGADVQVIAKGNFDDYGRIENVNGFDVHRLTTRPVSLFPIGINRILSILYWAHYARKQHPDIISGHDLEGLVIGWLSVWFLGGTKRPKLVYDSHEFELGRNIDRSDLKLKCIKMLERWLISRSCFTIVVNDSIAKELKRIHHMANLPIVVRNIPRMWDVDDVACGKTRKKLLEEMHCSEGTLLLYHGAVVPGRGIEKCIEVLTFDEELRLLILGDDLGETYRSRLKDLAKTLRVDSRILFRNAVPYADLWKYVGAVDISMVIIEPRVESYYFSLPNKLFESIQAHTPLVASNLPEIKNIVEKYQVGEICDPGKKEDVYEAIKRLKTNKLLWQKYKDNEVEAAKELNWENESEILWRAYRELMRECVE